MSKKVTINCDNCQQEITPNENTPREYLVLTSKTYAAISPMLFAIQQQPMLAEDKYFCDLGCLIKWTKKNQTTPYTDYSLDAHIEAVGKSDTRLDNPMGLNMKDLSETNVPTIKSDPNTGIYKLPPEKIEVVTPEEPHCGCTKATYCRPEHNPGFHSPGSSF